jgi:hypothetical protein
VKKIPTSQPIAPAALARMNGGYAQSSVPLLEISASRLGALGFDFDMVISPKIFHHKVHKENLWEGYSPSLAQP